jgi:SAM-dependent methyltransferase
VCGSLEARFAFTRGEIDVARCHVCTCEFAHPQPSDEVLEKIYTADYFLGGARAAEANARHKRATAALYLEVLARNVRPGGRILEIGCGSGEFLIEAADRGFEVAGIEYAQAAANRANAALGREAVMCGSIDTSRPEPAAFDAVACFDVLEHVRSPRAFLRCVHECLRPAGLIALVTPSLDSWSRRLLGRDWMEYKTEHLCYFNRKSLRLLLEACGFEAVEFHPNRKVLTFDYICRHFERFRVPFWTPALLALRRAVPRVAAERHVKLVASGVMAVAKKRASPECTH